MLSLKKRIVCVKKKKEVDNVKIIRIKHFVSKSKCINKNFMCAKCIVSKPKAFW
jgi:hypothetical protein